MKKIMIDATGGSKWIGGLYYKKNIIFSLLQNEYINKSYEIILVTDPENEPIFSCFLTKITVQSLNYKNHRERKLKILALCLRYKCKYIFPSTDEHYNKFGIMNINWIPDFQHNHIPEYFSDEDAKSRTKSYEKMVESKSPLILSSNDALKDFREFYSKEKENVYVVPFVSYIEPEIESLTPDIEAKILKRFDLQNLEYVCVANQFWKHKNHIVIFKAISDLLQRKSNCNIRFVFTGNMNDYRNLDYINELKKYTNDPSIAKRISILGFIDRREQIVLMKNATFMIQPSLFEGWGTVVEDSKVLDKTVLLSNIPVHREQKNEKCILFDPYSSSELATLIEQEFCKKHYDSVEKGVSDMYKQGYEYSKRFEKILQT